MGGSGLESEDKRGNRGHFGLTGGAAGGLPVEGSAGLVTLINAVDTAIGTVFLPTPAGTMDMEGWKDFSLTGDITDADGTITVTVEGTNDPVAAPASHKDVSQTGWDTENNTDGFASKTVTNGTLSIAWDFDNWNYAYMRVSIVFSGNTNTAVLYLRRKTL